MAFGGFLHSVFKNPIVRTIATLGAAAIPGVGPGLATAIGAGLGAVGTGSLTGTALGALGGYGASGTIGALGSAGSAASGASGANLAAGAFGPVTTGAGTAQVFGNALLDSATSAGSLLSNAGKLVGPVSGILGAINGASATQPGSAIGAAPPPAATAPAPFSPVRPGEMSAPSSLSGLAAYSPDQQRSALATRGINQGLGKDENSYYQNLIQRSLIGDNNQITGSVNSLLPIESQYFNRQGIDTNDTNAFLKAIRG